MLWSHIGLRMHLLAAEPRSTAGLLFPSRYLSRTILVTLCSTVLDWRVSRVGPIPFCWPSCSFPFCLLLFFPSLLSFYGLVLWGWGLTTNRVLIVLPALHCRPFLIIIIITNFHVLSFDIYDIPTYEHRN